jgi:hypothetical protein
MGNAEDKVKKAKLKREQPLAKDENEEGSGSFLETITFGIGAGTPGWGSTNNLFGTGGNVGFQSQFGGGLFGTGGNVGQSGLPGIVVV